MTTDGKRDDSPEAEGGRQFAERMGEMRVTRQELLGHSSKSCAGRWSKADLLGRIKDPDVGGTEIVHVVRNVTFEGTKNQPDFGSLRVVLYPHKHVLELKSFKIYIGAWRSSVVSYERFIWALYHDLMFALRPARLRVVLDTEPRGGISSHLVKDSDWSINGGSEAFADWKGRVPEAFSRLNSERDDR
jgi:7-cyano-7-deazaguanine reductase